MLFLLLACSLSSLSVSFDTVEDARGTARENALYNAQTFRQGSSLYQDWSVESRGDSSQTNDCPQGDGWATLRLTNPGKSQTLNVKCSTVSKNIGCLPEDEFKGKEYAAEDGHCQSVDKVPFPLPKIEK